VSHIAVVSRVIAVTAIASLMLVSLGSCSLLRHAVPHNPESKHIGQPVVESGATAVSGRFEIGVYEHGDTSSYQSITRFGDVIKAHVGIVTYYSAWREAFQLAFAEAAHRHGAAPLVQIEPTDISLAAVAAGSYDDYLRSYARAVKAFGYPVIIGFGHEMNGSWYSWGFRRTKAAVWVRAWRHIVDVFRSEGAKNVAWLWTISHHVGAGTGPLSAYWPGAGYVNCVGIDGYYVAPSDTFRTVFAPAVRAVRSLTRDPIILSEAAVGRTTGHRSLDVENLFAGIRQYQIEGIVWFDVAQQGSVIHQDWRLEGDPDSIAAFRRGIRRLGIVSS